MARSSMPSYPEKFFVRAADPDHVAQAEAQDVEVVDGVLDQASTAGLGDVGAPGGAVGPLNRKVLVVSDRGRHRPSQCPRRHQRAQRRERPGPSAGPDLTGPARQRRRPRRPVTARRPGRWPMVSRRRWRGRQPEPHRPRRGGPLSGCRPRRHRTAPSGPGAHPPPRRRGRPRIPGPAGRCDRAPRRRRPRSHRRRSSPAAPARGPRRSGPSRRTRSAARRRHYAGRAHGAIRARRAPTVNGRARATPERRRSGR